MVLRTPACIKQLKPAGTLGLTLRLFLKWQVGNQALAFEKI